MPNRYKSFRNAAPAFEENNNTKIYRISLSDFRIKYFDQAIAFISYWRGVKKIIKNQKYDLVFVTSGRFFSAFLGAIIAKETRIPYYLDIRDILSDSISDIVNNKIVKFFLNIN